MLFNKRYFTVQLKNVYLVRLDFSILLLNRFLEKQELCVQFSSILQLSQILQSKLTSTGLNLKDFKFFMDDLFYAETFFLKT